MDSVNRTISWQYEIAIFYRKSGKSGVQEDEADLTLVRYLALVPQRIPPLNCSSSAPAIGYICSRNFGAIGASPGRPVLFTRWGCQLRSVFDQPALTGLQERDRGVVGLELFARAAQMHVDSLQTDIEGFGDGGVAAE